MVDAVLLSVQSLSKWFGKEQVLRSISLDLGAGRTMAVCGRSGSGKSTLIRCLIGLEDFQEGSVIAFGETITPNSPRDHTLRRRFGMVFQRFSLYPHMTVMNNVTLALRKVQKQPREEAEQNAVAALVNVGLGAHTLRFPNELSGGQQQRVAIARALVLAPEILLLDEPTSALDPETSREVLDVLRKLRLQGMTQVLVTHEMGFAKDAADEVVLIEEGCVVEHTESAKFFSDSASKRASYFRGNSTSQQEGK